MAASLSSQSLLGSCPCSTSLSSKPFQTRQPKIARFPSRPIYTTSNLATILGFPTPLSSVNRRTLFKSYLASQDSLPTNSEDGRNRSCAAELAVEKDVARGWCTCKHSDAQVSTRNETNDETEETQNDTRVKNDDEDQKPLPSLVVLIEAYKEAFLNGNEKMASQIEERIHSIANEKNKLIQKVSTLSAEKVASKEKYVRLQADFDNFRKKYDKDRLNTLSNAQQEVIRKLLLLVDNFERVKQQTGAATEKEKKIDVSYQGIYKQFVETMRSHHVSVVATVGKPFNPLLHEAIAREESEVFKEGIIIKESRRGFLFRDKVLRPALVKVSLGPGNQKSPAALAKSMDRPSTVAGIDER